MSSKIDYSSASDEELRPLTGKRNVRQSQQTKAQSYQNRQETVTSPLFKDEDETFESGSNDDWIQSRVSGQFAARQSLPLRTKLTAFFLLGVGVLFLSLGQHEMRHKSLSDATAFLVLGMIGIIPGAYASFIIVAVWIGIEGYSYDMVPTYD